MVKTPNPIKGSGQILKSFEQELEYITTDDVQADSDGYIRGDRNIKYELKGAVVPIDEENLSHIDYNDDITGFREVYIRTKGQDLAEEIELEVGDYFDIDGVEWKLISVDDYGTVIICTVGKSEEGGYPVK